MENREEDKHGEQITIRSNKQEIKERSINNKKEEECNNENTT